MKIGMLWYDNSIKDNLETRISRAIEYYRNKYDFQGRMAVYVNPAMVQEITLPEVSLYSSRSILLNHFWVGQEDKEGK